MPGQATAETTSHVFLGAGHARNERRTWIVIWLCAAMMVLEIAGGLMFGSITLDGGDRRIDSISGAWAPAILARFSPSTRRKPATRTITAGCSAASAHCRTSRSRSGGAR